MAKELLISGTTGFVGSNLVPYLVQKGYTIQPLSREALTNGNYSIAPSIDAVVHLAGKAHDLKNVGDDAAYFTVNYEYAKQLFDQFLKSDAEVFIFISSVKAAADAVEGVLMESDKANPITAYGRSKLKAEKYILTQPIPIGKRVLILRPCMIHGPGNKGNLNLLYKVVSKNVPWPLGVFENKRSFCSIDNLIFIIKELIERENIPSGIYNVADDEPLSTNELINLIAESQNRKPRIWKLSKGFIERVAKIGDKLHLPLNSERLQKLTESYVASSEKVQKALGEPLPVSSKEGLLKSFQSFNYK
jgi:nucleoside-diphosphate-sugar epimerase